ncbi:SagB family peptide dehydrogenase [Kitasatospora sp. NPDC004669]|uniref:SagB family peptide dehydrogenase n=1 Tax=Kitasatospora sp. NPDC004669 TaxID=3154555 RepID=UPI0033B989AE
MGVAHDYADAILHRARIPMEPVGFEPDWADQPREHSYHPGAERLPLPPWRTPPQATTQRALTGPAGTGAFTLPALGGMLLDSYGLTSRRLAVHANVNLETMPDYTAAGWARGCGSGGGLYPLEIYWAAGASGPLTPGVYHYAVPHHAMQRLLTGDVTAQVRAALGPAAKGVADTDQFLIISVRFWKNTFKYNSFGYHVVSMDIGALLHTWRLWARAHGLRLDGEFWFDEPRLTRLLGLREHQEGVFAVVPLRWDGAPTAPSPDTGQRVRRAPEERSRAVLTFDTIRRLHAATLTTGALPAEPPAPALPVPPDGDRVTLPAPTPLPTDLRTALRTRRSSFGRFSGKTPMAADRLSALLASAASAGERLTRLYVFVNHVADVAPGSYLYDGATGELRLVKAGPRGAFLQRNYTLDNYNLEQAAAVIVPTVRVPALLDAVGDRGYRLANAAIGASSQAFYTAAAACGLGCGVALAFDGVSYSEELGLTGTGELPLLITAVGPERPDPADYRYEVA